MTDDWSEQEMEEGLEEDLEPAPDFVDRLKAKVRACGPYIPYPTPHLRGHLPEQIPEHEVTVERFVASHSEAALPDAGLVSEAGQGNLAAYRELVMRHHQRLIRSAKFMLDNPDRGKDLAQDAFAGAYEWVAAGADVPSFGAWVFEILRYRCIMANKKAAFKHQPSEPRGISEERQLHYDELCDGLYYGLNETDAQDPEWELPDSIVTFLRSARVRAFLSLALLDRDLLQLKYIADVSYEEMAELAGTSVPAVQRHLRRVGHLLCQRMAYAQEDGIYTERDEYALASTKVIAAALGDPEEPDLEFVDRVMAKVEQYVPYIP